jgi:hypothetical protein
MISGTRVNDPRIIWWSTDSFRVVAKLPVRAEDDVVVAGVSNRDISRRSASTSSLLSPPISVVEEEVSSVGVVVSTVEV